MSPQKGFRPRIACPEDCDMSKFKKGIDVRGLKGHLINKHNYTPEKATAVFEKLLGRKSLGRVPKPHQTYREAPEASVDGSTGIPTAPSDAQARAWFSMGVSMGREIEQRIQAAIREGKQKG